MSAVVVPDFLLPQHPQTDIYHPGKSCCDPVAREAIIRRIEAIANAAVDYVAARLANENAGRGEWAEAMVRLDDAWHALLEASGLSETREETEEGTR